MGMARVLFLCYGKNDCQISEKLDVTCLHGTGNVVVYPLCLHTGTGGGEQVL